MSNNNDINKKKSESEKNETSVKSVTPENKISKIFVRIFAVLALLVMLGLLGGLIYCIFFNGKYLIQMLFLVIIYPVILYIMVWLKKVFDKRED